MVNLKNLRFVYCLICLVSNVSIVAMEQVAALKTFVPILFMLLKEHADLSVIEKAIKDGEKVDEIYNNSTLLITAVGLGNKPLVQLLHEHGASFEQEAGANGMTPLKKAVWKQDESLVKFMLEQGAKVNFQDYFFKQTALFEAVKMAGQNKAYCDREKLIPVITTLMEYGADNAKPDFLQRTPLNIAQNAQDEEVVSLLEKKLDPVYRS